MTDTIFLKFIAIFLITNSHLDNLYPISALSTGGSLGNCLFFMLSGMGIGLSYAKSPSVQFMSWFWRRLSRIYAPLWITLLLFAIGLQATWKHWQFSDYISQFFYPTTYWFLSALVLFYLIMFVILKYKQVDKIPWFLLGLTGVYFYVYCSALDLSHFVVEDGGYFKWIFYLQVTLLGLYLSKFYSTIQPASKKDIGLLIAILGLYFGFKLLLAKNMFLSEQFLLQGLSFFWVYFALKLAKTSAIKTLINSRLLGPFIQTVSAMTLEVYLVQHYIYQAFFITVLRFPVNILVFWPLCLLAAYTVYWLTQRLFKQKAAS